VALSYRDVRIATVGVEASLSPLEGVATGPFGGIGRLLGYEALFGAARKAGGEAYLPWRERKLKANRFWRKYATAELADTPDGQWAEGAWRLLVPLKLIDPVAPISIHPNQSFARSEAYVWPSALGLCWNNWIGGPLDDDALAALVSGLRNGAVRRGGAEGGKSLKRVAAYHEAMNELRQTAWGEVKEGERSEPVTVVTVVRASADGPAGDAAAASLKALLAAIAPAWGPLKATPMADGGEGDQTVYTAKGLRLVWLPDKFLATERISTCGCLHRNLIVGLLSVEMVARTAVLLARTRRRLGQLPPTHASLVARTIERADFFLSGGGYSPPFLLSQLERDEVTKALAELKAG
jgi:hypothetical protein